MGDVRPADVDKIYERLNENIDKGTIIVDLDKYMNKYMVPREEAIRSIVRKYSGTTNKVEGDVFHTKLASMWRDLREWLNTGWKNDGLFDPVMKYMDELENKYGLEFEDRRGKTHGKTD